MDEVEVDFALAWSQLLNTNELPKCNRKNIVTLIRSQLQELGITRRGRISWGAWRDVILSNPYGRKLNAAGFSTIKDRRLRDVVARGILPRNPRHTILLVQTLFGGWKSAAENFDSRDIDSIQIESTAPYSGPISKAEKQRRLLMRREAEANAAMHAAKYAALRDFHPLESHTSLLEMLPISARFLTRQHLRGLGIEPASARRGVEVYLELDSSMSEHIEKTANAFCQCRFPGRISRARLIAGHRRGKTLSDVLDKLPKVQTMLAKYEEDEAKHRRRILRRLTGGGEVYFFENHESDYIDALSDKEVVERLNAIYKKKWSRKWK